MVLYDPRVLSMGKPLPDRLVFPFIENRELLELSCPKACMGGRLRLF
jgi:hypothetical protein